MNSEEKNAILLLFLGIYKPNSQEDDYTYKINGEETKVKGVQTSDAPVQCLIDCAKSDGNKINNIYCIVSESVYNDKIMINGEEKTSYEFFTDKYAKQGINIFPIYYDFEIDDNKKIQESDYALHIYKQLSSQLEKLRNSESGEIPIYIDYTSGLRDVSFLMTAIIRYLQIWGVELKK